PGLSEGGWKQLRIEQGIAQMGVDFGEDNYPQEAGLERDAVSFEKGCYLGQETVFMLEKRGHVKKRIVQLEVEGAGELAPETPIADADGQTTGSVTSAVPRRSEGGAIALGWVKYKHARAGVTLDVGGHPARVTDVLALARD